MSDEEAAFEAEIERLLGSAALYCGTDERLWRHFLNGLSERVRRALLERWHWQAHGGQREPDQPWTVWLLMAGRGFGKTRAGAEWVSQRARETPNARIALVGGKPRRRRQGDGRGTERAGQGGAGERARAVEADNWHRALFERGDGVRLFGRGGRRLARAASIISPGADELAKWGRTASTARRTRRGTI